MGRIFKDLARRHRSCTALALAYLHKVHVLLPLCVSCSRGCAPPEDARLSAAVLTSKSRQTCPLTALLGVNVLEETAALLKPSREKKKAGVCGSGAVCSR